MRQTLPLLLAAKLGTLAAFSQDLPSQLDAQFAQYNAHTPGVALAVLHQGKVVFQKGYGSANLDHRLPITENTVFHAASVSKQFTAFAIYLLEKQGKLSLTDPVQKHIPELPHYGQPFLIHHLLGHTSGIRDHNALMTLAGWRMDDALTAPQALRLLTRQKELNFPPGSAYLYGNSGYFLLAEIVQRASGESLAAFTQRHIFTPLQMTHTRFCDDPETVIPHRADSYYKEKGVYKRVLLNDAVAGPSNLVTTVTDLAKWALNFENPTVGDPDLIRRFNQPSLLNNGERAVYYSQPGDIGYHAKGQVQRLYRGLDVLSHGGHTAGFRSTFWRFPTQRFAFVLLSNDEHFEQLRHGEAVADLYLKDVLGPKPAAAPSPAPPPAAPKNNRLTDFTGRFANAELETTYQAQVVQGKLVLTHLRHGDIPLAPAGPDTFTGRIEFPVSVNFRRNPAGQVTELRLSNFGAKNIRFAKSPTP